MMESIWLGVHLLGFGLSAGSLLVLLFSRPGMGTAKKVLWGLRVGLPVLLVSGFALVSSWSSALHSPLFLAKLALVGLIAIMYLGLEQRLVVKKKFSRLLVSQQEK